MVGTYFNNSISSANVSFLGNQTTSWRAFGQTERTGSAHFLCHLGKDAGIRQVCPQKQAVCRDKMSSQTPLENGVLLICVSGIDGLNG